MYTSHLYRALGIALVAAGTVFNAVQGMLKEEEQACTRTHTHTHTHTRDSVHMYCMSFPKTFVNIMDLLNVQFVNLFGYYM